MQLSTKHATARTDAARPAALQASLALLAGGAFIRLYASATPDEGQRLVEIPLADPPGTFEDNPPRLVLDTPIEGQVTTAGTPESARIFDAAGDTWADVTVSGPDGGGELELEAAELYQGAFARIASAEFEG